MIQMTEFWQEGVEQTEMGAKVKFLAKKLHTDFSRAEIVARISQCNIPGADSKDVQAVLIEPAKSCGFVSEAKGLFKNYQVSGLRPDYHLSIGNDGIIFEVERGKTTRNNMDMLDLWKCHLCEHANFLFIAVPLLLQQNQEQASSGKGTKEYSAVCRRLGTFFVKGNYTNVKGLVVFGY